MTTKLDYTRGLLQQVATDAADVGAVSNFATASSLRVTFPSTDAAAASLFAQQETLKYGVLCTFQETTILIVTVPDSIIPADLLPGSTTTTTTTTGGVPTGIAGTPNPAVVTVQGIDGGVSVNVPRGTLADPYKVDVTGQTTQPVLVTNFPPGTSNPATEPTLQTVATNTQDALPDLASISANTAAALAALASILTNTGRIPASGQANMLNSKPVVIASDQSAIPISGSITATNPSVSVDGNAKPASATMVGGHDGTNLRAVRSFDLDSGAGTEYDLGVNLRATSSGGSVEAGTATSPLRTDPTGTTPQPVTASALPLPSGAATSALQTTGNTSVGNIDTKTPALGQAAMAASSPVVIASNQSNLPCKESRPSTSAVTSVAAAVADTSLLASNANRLGFSVFNDSTAILYLKFGTGSSTTSFTVKMAAGSYYEAPLNAYTGAVNGYWSVANGSARITELT